MIASGLARLSTAQTCYGNPRHMQDWGVEGRRLHVTGGGTGRETGITQWDGMGQSGARGHSRQVQVQYSRQAKYLFEAGREGMYLQKTSQKMEWDETGPLIENIFRDNGRPDRLRWERK